MRKGETLHLKHFVLCLVHRKCYINTSFYYCVNIYTHSYFDCKVVSGGRYLLQRLLGGGEEHGTLSLTSEEKSGWDIPGPLVRGQKLGKEKMLSTF